MPEVQPKPLIIAKPVSPAGNSPGSNSASPDGSIKLNVSRKYVLPPRPKPGRKPSADTPPNRRKAQNREAQRAFRERRAAAVQELEAKLDEVAEKHAEEQQALQQVIAKLQAENEQLKTMRTPPSMFSPPAGMSPKPILSPMTNFFAPSPVFASGDPGLEVLDRVLDQRLPVPNKGYSPMSTSPKSPRSPTAFKRVGPPPVQGLRLLESDWKQPAIPLRRRLSSLETDFTNRFRDVPSKLDDRRRRLSSAVSPFETKIPSPPNVVQDTANEFQRRPEDRCGFCTDDTPCVCMEAAQRERSNMADIETLGGNIIPVCSSKGISSPSLPGSPSQSQSAHNTPSPSIPDSPVPRTGECTGNPGTCTQCQEDPMSTLFCTTVASKTTNSHIKSGTFIPAQAAYRTLSRHAGFARVDFSTVVSSLETRGTQVEVNSVAKVLRMLDRRVYA